MYEGHICDVPGITVGHAQHEQARTGVTVLLCAQDSIGGVDVRGGSPGTRETDLLHPTSTVSVVHSIVLSGGSAFGLDSMGGVMHLLEERGIGYETAAARVPIVCGAVLYDLAVGDPAIRPDAAMGYEAAQSACKDFRQGAYGAGCGATLGKGVPNAIPARGGVGSASLHLPGGVIVGAMVAVNALGDVYDPHSGQVLACATLDGKPVTLLSTLMDGKESYPAGNTTIGVVATNAKMTKAEANRLAGAAHDGMALSIRPVHTPYDGDTLFALSTGDLVCHPMLLHMAAVEVVARAIANAVLALKG